MLARSGGRAKGLVPSLIRLITAFCGGLAVLTLFWPDWIEVLTGYDSDQHNGMVEWLIVIALLSTAPYWRSRRRGQTRRALSVAREGRFGRNGMAAPCVEHVQKMKDVIYVEFHHLVPSRRK
jgi:hypothetical protein